MRLKCHSSFVFICCFIVLLLIYVIYGRLSSPLLRFNSTKYNFGKVPVGTQGVCKIIVSNDSFDFVRITQLKKSCACTEVKLKEGWIRPFGKTELVITMKPTLYESFVSANVAIVYDNFLGRKVNQTSLIEVSGNYVGLATPSPQSLEFDFSAQDSPQVEKKINIKRGKLDVPWDNLLIVNSGLCKAVSTQVDSDTFELSVTTRPEQTIIGSVRSEIVIGFSKEGHDICGTIRIPVVINTSCKIHTNVKQIYFGSIIRGSKSLETVHFSSVDGSPISIEKVESSDPDFIKCDIKKTSLSGSESDLECMIVGSNSGGPQSGYIDAYVTSEKTYRIRVPVYWAIKTYDTKNR